MRYICDGQSEHCKETIDSEKDIGYTLINNVTGKRYVLCEPCVRQITSPKAIQINTLLREVNKVHKAKKVEGKNGKPV